MNMIEAVARALCAAQGFDWDAQAYAMTSASSGDDEREHYLEQARAALDAIREPTMAMIESGAANHKAEYRIVGHPNRQLSAAAQCWRAMVDEAMNIDQQKTINDAS